VQYDNHVVHVPCTVNTVAPVEPPPIDPKLRIPRVPPARPGAPAEGPPGASPSPTAVPAAGEGSTVWDSLRDIFEKSRAQDRIVLEVVARPAAAFRALAAIPPTAVPWLVVTEMALCFSVALVVGLLSGSFSSPRAGDAAGTALTLALLLCAVGPGWAAWVYVWRAGHRAACRRLRVELPVEQAQLLIVYATAPQLLAGTGVCFLLGMGLGCGAVPVWPMMVASWLGTIWHLALVAVGTREMTGLGWADATLATALGGGALFLVATQVLIVWAA